MLVVGQPHQPRPQQRAARPGRTGRRRPPRRARAASAALGAGGRSGRPPAAASGPAGDPLHGPAVRGRRWCAAPRAARPAVQRAPSAAASSGPRSRSGSEMLYVGHRRLELVEEPQPLLGERGRQRAAPGRTGPIGAARRRRPAAATRASAATVGASKRARWQLDPERAARSRRRPAGWPAASGRRGRRSCRRRRPADPEHLGPDLGDRLLGRAWPGGRVLRACRGGRSGRRQRARSSLPLGVSGSGVERDEGGRHHVVGQRAAAPARSSPASGAAPARAPRRRPAACRPARPRATTTAASRTPGVRPAAPPRSRPARSGSPGP